MKERCKDCNPNNCKNTNCSLLSAHIAWETVFDFATEQIEKVEDQKNEDKTNL